MGMDKNKFWSIVASIGWGMDSPDTHLAMRDFMIAHSKETAKEFLETYRELKNALEDVMDADEKRHGSYGLGDDNWNDLLNHIMGLGEAEYHRVMENPRLAYQRAEEGQYRESFSYCLPCPERRFAPGTSDYDYLTREYYVKQAKDNIERGGEIDFTEIPEKYHTAIRTVLFANALLIQGDLDGVLPMLDDYKEAFKLARGYLHYGFPNLISDMLCFIHAKPQKLY